LTPLVRNNTMGKTGKTMGKTSKMGKTGKTSKTKLTGADKLKGDRAPQGLVPLVPIAPAAMLAKCHDVLGPVLLLSTRNEYGDCCKDDELSTVHRVPLSGDAARLTLNGEETSLTFSSATRVAYDDLLTSVQTGTLRSYADEWSVCRHLDAPLAGYHRQFAHNDEDKSTAAAATFHAAVVAADLPTDVADQVLRFAAYRRLVRKHNCGCDKVSEGQYDVTGAATFTSSAVMSVEVTMQDM